MKKLVLLLGCLIPALGWAQIGINTTEASSTLTVNGSISGKYKEISSTKYQIQEDDFNLAYLGTELSGFELPNLKQKKITGRIYTIKNASQIIIIKKYL